MVITLIGLVEELEKITWKDATNDDLTDSLRFMVVFLSRIPFSDTISGEEWYDSAKFTRSMDSKSGQWKYYPKLETGSSSGVNLNFDSSGYIS